VTIEWRDPPPQITRRGAWDTYLLPVMEHPGRWAMIRSGENSKQASTWAANLRRSRSTVPPGKWEFVVRGHELFARYIGPE
jgi:hypothetical protein